MSNGFSPVTEQHAVQELTKASMSGVAIDGDVLSCLELAQVSAHCSLKILLPTVALVVALFVLLHLRNSKSLLLRATDNKTDSYFLL